MLVGGHFTVDAASRRKPVRNAVSGASFGRPVAYSKSIKKLLADSKVMEIAAGNNTK